MDGSVESRCTNGPTGHTARPTSGRSRTRSDRNTVDQIAREPNFDTAFDGLRLNDKWEAHSDRFARQLSDRNWTTVEAAYEIVATLAYIDTVRFKSTEEVRTGVRRRHDEPRREGTRRHRGSNQVSE